MKYIVLTFDDGLIDFKNNAIPILDKYGFKCTLAVVSGYSDRTIQTKREYISNDDIISLHNNGHEIALHSNSHFKEASSKDFELCKSKIINIIGNNDFGLAIPYSNQITREFMNYFLDNKYLYLFDFKKTIKMNSVERILYLINKIIRNKYISLRISSRHYRYKKSMLKPYSNLIFRMPATKSNNVSKIKYIISKMKNNDCYSIMFHSIIKNVGDDCEWPDGAWTCSEFDSLLHYLHKRKDICVLTQKELIKIGK